MYLFTCRGRLSERRTVSPGALHVRSHPRLGQMSVVPRLEPDGHQILPQALHEAAELRYPPAVRHRPVQRRRVCLLPRPERSVALPRKVSSPTQKGQ